ncbi:SDR family NAD(P)-dependent oxidoreductase (plasmid) [Rhodococcus sp. USK10]|uniref:SDR family NAD(P)-dependent oxidoreductase n=1 Tax=Rhodococcus sp. USK10 TaxID=2789739 RepID=UPI001C5F73B8|nr:SDR family NAD(P)-dependent oxidoreductase [Rhodococcus sp. USK10]QYB00110.1 SDR family NAD(P)-dependent oxidoreductase [Rhodococcus sp. USK10]
MNDVVQEMNMIDAERLNFDGRVALVTGAGSGMGREHAVMLASRGAKVVVNDIATRAAADTVRAITDAGGTAVADNNNVVTNASELVRSAIDNYSRLDIVINNAGIAGFGCFWEMDEGHWWNIFDTHVRGTVEVSRHAMPHLITSGSGRLINTSSHGMLGTPHGSAYSAAKAAIWGFSNSLADEAGAAGVQVNTVMPSAWTPMTANSFDNPAVAKFLQERLPANAVAAFVTWLAHQDTTVHGETFQSAGVSAVRTVFSVRPRVRVESATPEDWAHNAESLLRDGELTPIRNGIESFRAEIVSFDPSMDAEIARAGGAIEPK